MIGYSLREYAAMFVAGVYSLTDIFYLISRRAYIIEKSCVAGAYTILSVYIAVDPLESLLRKPDLSEYLIAYYNSRDSTIVSGPTN